VRAASSKWTPPGCSTVPTSPWPSKMPNALSADQADDAAPQPAQPSNITKPNPLCRISHLPGKSCWLLYEARRLRLDRMLGAGYKPPGLIAGEVPFMNPTFEQVFFIVAVLVLVVSCVASLALLCYQPGRGLGGLPAGTAFLIAGLLAAAPMAASHATDGGIGLLAGVAVDVAAAFFLTVIVLGTARHGPAAKFLFPAGVGLAVMAAALAVAPLTESALGLPHGQDMVVYL